MAKKRTPIPSNLSAKVEFDSDRTCCVCRKPDNPIQIHHLDEDPSNNAEENLVVLCLVCHDKTQVRGGFSRHLDSALIELYRKDWYALVAKNRETYLSRSEKSDLNRIIETDDASIGKGKALLERLEQIKVEAGKKLLSATDQKGELARHLMRLPNERKKLIEKAKLGPQDNSTAGMLRNNSSMVTGLVELMAELTKYFGDGPLSGPNGKEYLESKIKSLYEWKRACERTIGNTGRGTISNVLLTSSVILEVEKLLEDMVESLSEDLFGFNYIEWKRLWKAEN